MEKCEGLPECLYGYNGCYWGKKPGYLRDPEDEEPGYHFPNVFEVDFSWIKECKRGAGLKA